MRRTLRNRLLVRFFLVIGLIGSGVMLTLLVVAEVGERTTQLIDRYWQDSTLLTRVHTLLGEVTLFLDLPPGHPEAVGALHQLQEEISSLSRQIAVSTFREDFRAQQVAQLSQLKASLAEPAEILSQIESQNRDADAFMARLVKMAPGPGRGELEFDLNIAALAYRDFHITANPSDLQIFRQQIARITSRPLPPRLAADFAAFQRSGEGVFARRIQLRESRERIAAQIKALSASLRQRTELYTQRVVVPARDKIRDGLASISEILLTAVILGGLLALGTAILFARQISVPLEHAAGALKRIELGDLEARVAPSGNDEIDLIGRAVNSLAISLGQTLDHLNATVDRLRESEVRFREIAEQRLDLERIINASPTVAFLCQATAGFPVVYMSRSIDQFGFQPENFRGDGKTIVDLLHADDRGRVAAAFSKRLDDTGTLESFEEFRLCTAAGDTRWVDCRLQVQRDSDGAATHLQGVLLDITEKISLREQAAQASRLAALGELAAGVAHEINNPNATILLNARVLAEIGDGMLRLLDEVWQERGQFDVGRLPYPRLREEIPRLQAEIIESAGRIRRIVDDLKEFSRTEPPEPSRAVDLNAVVQKAVRLTRNVIRKATDAFTVDYAADLPPFSGHSQRLEQVAINLLINACQSLPGRQAGIQIKTGFLGAENALFFEVRDEGSGIAPADLPHVTDPFFTTRRDRGGTGLGLSMSARIAREHGGRLLIDSVPGRGTRVKVVLPLGDKEPGP